MGAWAVYGCIAIQHSEGPGRAAIFWASAVEIS